jgi:cupin superfamily acireductone dioxygenase involved in methionine salvage
VTAVTAVADENRSLHDYNRVRDFLKRISIDYESWAPITDIPTGASAEVILTAYAGRINELK